MKTEHFSLQDVGAFFAGVPSMHDCSFTVSYQNNTLIVVFDHLEQYFGPAPSGPWFGVFQKCTVKYRNVKFLDLTLKYGRKEKFFADIVGVLDGKELVMFGYSVDSARHLILDFRIGVKKKWWGGILKMTPDMVEYIWE